MRHHLRINKNMLAPNPTTEEEYPVRFWHQNEELKEQLPISNSITPTSGIALIKPLYKVGQTYQTTPPTVEWQPSAYAFITHATARTLNLKDSNLEVHLDDAIDKLNAYLQRQMYSLQTAAGEKRVPSGLELPAACHPSAG